MKRIAFIASSLTSAFCYNFLLTILPYAFHRIEFRCLLPVSTSTKMGTKASLSIAQREQVMSLHQEGYSERAISEKLKFISE